MGETAFDVGLTLMAYASARWIYDRSGRHPLANPTMVAIVLVICGILASGQHYGDYQRGGRLVGWFLGPATVALGIPLAHNVRTIARDALAVGLAVIAGALVAALSAALSMRWLGGTAIMAASIAPKAATAPIAMGLAGEIGGLPVLAAVFAILGGVFVAVSVRPVMAMMRIGDHRVFGLAAGVAGSGIGAAEAVERHQDAGAYAALAVGLNAVGTAILIPILVALGML